MLEAKGTLNKPLLAMTDSELESFLTATLGLPKGAQLTDELFCQLLRVGQYKVLPCAIEDIIELIEE
jgi:hypothetical protein